MHLTTLTDYSMRLLMYVARHPDRLCTIAEIADAYGISAAHLMKVTHQLGLAGWIETVRGKGGGMRLAHAPDAIRLGDVVRSVEPDFRMVECFDKSGVNDCRLDGHCRLSGILEGALQDFLGHLDRYTLADILSPPPDALSLQTAEAVLRRFR
jgi:Rrf2 family transcriptional regulator, nitric oxide-sensitive transcriptional repressor